MTVDHRYGRIKLTGRLLDGFLESVMSSELHVVDMVEYDRVNDTWTFLAQGPDFPTIPEGCVTPYVDGGDLQRNREWREAQDDS